MLLVAAADAAKAVIDQSMLRQLMMTFFKMI